MTAIPLLVKPKWLTLKNSWRRRAERRSLWARNGILCGLTITVMFCAYYGGYWVLEQTQQQLDFAYLQASLILGLILVFLLSMLCLTNTAAALGTLFLSKDLDFILSSPTSCPRFFWGKFIDIVVSSSWMTAVFLLPFIILFGRFYSAPLTYYLVALLTFIPFFVIPAACAIIIACAIAVFAPMNRKRELTIILLALALFGIYSLARLLATSFKGDGPVDVSDIFRVITFLSLANAEWSPSFWVSGILGEYLEPAGHSVFYLQILLFSSATAALSLAYLCLSYLHFPGYSKIGLCGPANKVSSRRAQWFVEKIMPFRNTTLRALAVKELKSTTRDLTQSVQGLLLIGLCALYLYMLNFQNLFQHALPASQQNWWRAFLLITNICLEAFVITAIGTRLVFPTVSRESHSYWILQTAPISTLRILQFKFFTWFVIVGLFTGVTFSIASLLLYSSFYVAAAKFVLTAIICYGLIGLGIGAGAYFADFNWEHPSQLTAGFGSLIYMLLGVMLIAVNLILTALVIYLSFLRQAVSPGHSLSYLIFTVAALAFIILSNVLTAHWAIRFGARSLENEVQHSF